MGCFVTPSKGDEAAHLVSSSRFSCVGRVFLFIFTLLKFDPSRRKEIHCLPSTAYIGVCSRATIKLPSAFQVSLLMYSVLRSQQYMSGDDGISSTYSVLVRAHVDKGACGAVFHWPGDVRRQVVQRWIHPVNCYRAVSFQRVEHGLCLFHKRFRIGNSFSFSFRSSGYEGGFGRRRHSSSSGW